MTLSSPLLSRLAAIVVLFAVCGAVWLGAIAPLRSVFLEQRARTERLIDLKERYRRAAANIAELRAQRDRVTAKGAQRQDLLQAPSAAAAAALMQSDLKRVIEAANGELRRVQISAPEGGEVAERIELRVLAILTLEGLSAALFALEVEDPRYRVGDLRVEPGRSQRDVQAGNLTVRFDLYGFRPRPKPSASPARPAAPVTPPKLRRIGDG